MRDNPRMASDGRHRGAVHVRRFDSVHEADKADREHWARMSDAERVLEVWRLSEEQWRLNGQHESGFSRSVTRVRRR